MNVKYQCGDCGKFHTEEQEGIKCCNGSEGAMEVSECCGEEIYPVTKTDRQVIGASNDRYPTVDVPYEVWICNKCKSSIE